MYGVYSLGRPKTKTYYKTTKACYDVLDGTYFSTTYSENLDNPRIIKVYTPLNDNGKRNLRIYALDGQSDNPSDYIDIELSDESLISEYKNITDNKNTPEEFRVVEITTNVDTEESFDKKGSSALTVLYAFLVMTLWAVMDILVSNRFEIGAVNMFFGDSFETIQDLFKAKKRIKEELLERKELEDDFSNFKSEFEKLVKMDDEKQKKLKLK